MRPVSPSRNGGRRSEPDAGWNEECVDRCQGKTLLAEQEVATAFVNDIDLILLVWLLVIVSKRSVVAELESPMLQQDPVQAVSGVGDGRECFLRRYAFSHGFRLECATRS